MQPGPTDLSDVESTILDISEPSIVQHGSLYPRVSSTSLHNSSEEEPIDGSDSSVSASTVEAYFEDPKPTLSLPSRPLFEEDVINKPNNATLDNLPNEVLTHILSLLPAPTLNAVALLSKKLHGLVTTPHAWRIAFSRVFPGQDAIEWPTRTRDEEDLIRSERRWFTQLTCSASWRSEYILRTHLLRSLARGKPVKLTDNHAATSNRSVTYSSRLLATVNHLHATFLSEIKAPRFIHGADATFSASTSDPSTGKVDNWGLFDPQLLSQPADLFPDGNSPQSEAIVLPNCMDVSQPFGIVCGQGFRGGQSYFRSSDELRGRFLNETSGPPSHKIGIPKILPDTDAVSAVWIAKSINVPLATSDMVGIITGSTLGIVSIYSLGGATTTGCRIGKGQLTSRWAISPGVPIVSIKVDDSYNSARKECRRIWAVLLNALGEVYYITDMLSAALAGKAPEVNAWVSGRSGYWHLLEETRRTSREDPYQENGVYGSYLPRSSSNSMQLSAAQIAAETSGIEHYLQQPPSFFIKLYRGWDMLRKFEVDFAGDDLSGIGETIVVISTGATFGAPAAIRRFTRFTTTPTEVRMSQRSSEQTPNTLENLSSFRFFPSPSNFPPTAYDATLSEVPSVIGGWVSSVFSFDCRPGAEITASAIDMSTYAILRYGEHSTQAKAASSSAVTGGRHENADVPGQRCRYFAVGNKIGMVLLWNMRGSQPRNPKSANEVQPLRIIRTDSPQVNCLALSALYVVHGGSDGLVQAWDPLASTLQPLRTLNSRFSSRARRRLLQAEASHQGVGINVYAAGAIALDPNPTILRGMVSLGTHLRYWSYSAAAGDRHFGKKRRLRRAGQRGKNSNPDRVTSTGRGALMDYISAEQTELKDDKIRKLKEEARLRSRFGLGLGGLSEEEALHYAELISVETLRQDETRRMSDAGYFADTGESPSVQTPWRSNTIVTPSPPDYDEYDHDLEEAIRLSLLDGVDDGGGSLGASASGEYRIQIKYKHRENRRSASLSPSVSPSSRVKSTLAPREAKKTFETLELEAVQQLSLKECRTEKSACLDEQEAAAGVKGKGKGRAE